jgi:hypothetical protein
VKYKLYEEKQAHGVMLIVWSKVKESIQAGNKIVMEVTEETRSHPQNKKFHAIIGQIAKQASHHGARWTTEDWKRFLIDQWCQDRGLPGGEVVPSLDGQRVVQLGIQSRKFSKSEGADFIEWLLAWAAQNGIDIKEPQYEYLH